MKKKGLALVLAFALGLGALAGCGKKNSPDRLNITIYQAGYGTECIEAVAERFEELNPGKTVKLTLNEDGAILRTQMPAGPSINFTDMYFAGSTFFDVANLGAFTVDGVTYDNMFADITDVYEGPATGETVPIKEKMFPEYAEYFNIDGKYYMAPWAGGIEGIVYNSKMFSAYGWEVPATTDELLALCQTITETKAVSTNKNSRGEEISITPFIFSKEDSYWEAIYLEWWAQYDGLDTYRNFFKGLNAAGQYKADLVTTAGQRETMRLLDDILGTYHKDKTKRTNIYCDSKLSSRTYIDVQSTLFNGEEARVNKVGPTTAAMHPNGDWIENEMYSNYADKLDAGEIEFKIMKTPIISAIRDKTPSIPDDETLSAVVRYVDGTGARPDGVSDADVATIRAARGISYSGGIGHVILLPVYSTKTALAKEFIRFLYSDEGMEIYTRAGRGINMPLTRDYSDQIESMSALQKSKFDIVERTENYIFRYDNHPITYRAGLKPFMNILQYAAFVSILNAESASDYIDPDELFRLNSVAVAGVWDRMLDDAGLNG